MAQRRGKAGGLGSLRHQNHRGMKLQPRHRGIAAGNISQARHVGIFHRHRRGSASTPALCGGVLKRGIGSAAAWPLMLKACQRRRGVVGRMGYVNGSKKGERRRSWRPW